MKKIVVILLIIAITSVAAISAIDFNNQEKDYITLTGHDFKIPLKYSNGELGEDKYTYEDGDFEIANVNVTLPIDYGSLCKINTYCEKLEVDGRAVIHFNKIDYIDDSTISIVFFSCGESFYMIKYKEAELSEDIEEIIATSKKSNFTNDEFYEILDAANDEYIELYEANEKAGSYDDSYSYSADSYNVEREHRKDFLEFYAFYRLHNHKTL